MEDIKMAYNDRMVMTYNSVALVTHENAFMNLSTTPPLRKSLKIN